MREQDYDAKSFWNARYSQELTLGTAGNIAMGRQFNEWFGRLLHVVMKRAFDDLKIDFRGKRLFEMGFGTGDELAYWLELGASYVKGLEVSHIAIADASLRFGSQGWSFTEGDASTYAVPEAEFESYDISAAFAVLVMLVKDDAWENALGALCDAIKPGGYIVLTDGLRKSSALVPYLRMRTIEDYRDFFAAKGIDLILARPTGFLMTEPNAGQTLNLLRWRATRRLIRIANCVKLGRQVSWLIGFAYFVPDLFLTKVAKSGPGYHLVVARKRLVVS